MTLPVRSLVNKCRMATRWCVFDSGTAGTGAAATFVN